MNTAVILCAAGSSTRYAAGQDVLVSDRSKLDEDLGGRPVLQRAVELFCHRDDVATVVVAGPHDPAALAQFDLRQGERIQLLGGTLCGGGAHHRAESVAAALAHVPEDAAHIAVADAARPITPPDVIDRVFDAATSFPAVVPGIPVADTLKRTDPEPVDAPAADPLAAILAPGGQSPTARVITDTIDREHLFAVQTPQVFTAELLRRAYAQPEFHTATDDAALVERLGERVVIVPGDPANMKLTRQQDLRVIRALGNFKPPTERATHKKF
ncbi:MAG: 2-C-methyl-D-erythritol 4-phosphate cytidylyltransferase [Planctomycetota bacterium]